MSTEVIPGILENNWEEIEKKIALISKFSKTIHVDFIDGKFAENTTFLDPLPFSDYSQDVFLEAHLMVDDPLQHLSTLAQAGFKRFLGHIEKMNSQEEFVAQGQLLGEVGLALDLETSVSSIKVPLDDLDVILLMTVRAGQSGQDFHMASLARIEELRLTLQQVQGKQIPIEVDGGIDPQTLALCKKAGANRFVSTSFISNAKDPQAAFLALSKPFN
jgi:ribulose-phosphate 3-epimerase